MTVLDFIPALVDTAIIHDTIRLTDTLWVLQPHSWWRETAPAIGALAAVGAALLTAFFAYWSNRRILKYNIAYGSYQRALVRLHFLKQTLEQVRDVTADVGMFLNALHKVAGQQEVDKLKFTQDARNAWQLQTVRLGEVQSKMLNANEAVRAEYYGHLPVFPRLREAVSSYGFEIIKCGSNIAMLQSLFVVTQFKLEPFPFAETRRQLADAKERIFACLNDLDRWYYELLELLKHQVFAGIAKVNRSPTKRRGGNPDALHLTLDGFKTSKELGWYDQKLDTRRNKTKSKD